MHHDRQAVAGENLEHTPCDSFGTDREDNWDSLHDEWSSPSPLRTFILLSCRISTPTLLTLPATLTHLALINLPSAVPLHRLPGMCPLLSFLDLSFNRWLVKPGTVAKGGNPLDRVSWDNLNKLVVLALRGCNPSVAVLEKINRGRWTDIEIIQ
jgi:hypothetical protein